jgi:hypothetical protein
MSNMFLKSCGVYLHSLHMTQFVVLIARIVFATYDQYYQSDEAGN